MENTQKLRPAHTGQSKREGNTASTPNKQKKHQSRFACCCISHREGPKASAFRQLTAHNTSAVETPCRQFGSGTVRARWQKEAENANKVGSVENLAGNAVAVSSLSRAEADIFIICNRSVDKRPHDFFFFACSFPLKHCTRVYPNTISSPPAQHSSVTVRNNVGVALGWHSISFCYNDASEIMKYNCMRRRGVQCGMWIPRLWLVGFWLWRLCLRSVVFSIAFPIDKHDGVHRTGV